MLMDARWRRRITTGILSTILLLTASHAALGQTSPAPTSMSAPAASHIDDSDPRAALLSLLQTIQSGDRKSAENLIVFSPDQEAAVKTYLDLIFATRDMESAADSTFGQQSEQYFGSARQQLPARIDAVKNAPIKTVGDFALVALPADEQNNQHGGTVVVKKIDDHWKIDGATLFALNQSNPDQTNHALALAKKMIPITQDIAGQIRSHKFASAADAYQEFWNRPLAAARETGAAPATQKK